MPNKEKLLWTVRIMLGIIFIVSAYSKIISTGLIEIIIIEHGLATSRETAAIIVRLLIGAELGLGILLTQPFYLKRIVYPLVIIFLSVFTIYLVYTGFIIGDKQNCGCFGEMIAMSPLESILKNIVLLGLNIWLMISIKEEKKNISVPLIIMLVSIALVFVLSPVRSTKDFPFNSYTNFIGKGRVDLASGDKLLAVFNTECEHCQQTAKDLAQMQKKFKWFPEMYALIFVEGNTTVDSFKTITGSNFPYGTISVKEFFDLIGQSPPRIYWLHNGQIKEKWDENFIVKVTSAFANLK